MAALNALLARLVDGFLRPFDEASPLAGLAVVSLISAIGMLLVVRATSDQARVAAVKRALQACVFEIRLFNDDARAMLRALGEMLRHNLTYMRLATAPVLWMTVPLGLLLAQLHSHYGYDGLAVGQRAVVKARLRNSSTSPSPQARLAAPPGIRIETPPVWIPSIREVAWRVAAERPGDYVLKVQIGEDVFTKSVLVSDAIVRRSPLRTDERLLNQLLHPGEPPLPVGAEVESIAVTYPRRAVSVLGFQIHWMVIFFALSIVFALALRWRFRIVL
jgi:hypothetical protein